MNGIEKELSGRARVLQVNLLSREGKAVAARFDVKSAGTIIVIDASGIETYRHTGLPVRKNILKAVNGN